MKILTASILILGWLAMGLGIFADGLDSTTVNTVSSGILAQDADDDLDETKCSYFYESDVAFCPRTSTAKIVSIDIFRQLLNAPSLLRHQMFCVYRL
jgi:hypothetical protein